MTESNDGTGGGESIALAVPRQLVKQVKTALEKRNRASGSRIRVITAADVHLSAYEGKFLISTTFSLDGISRDDLTEVASLLSEEALVDHVDIVSNGKATTQNSARTPVMESAVEEWYLKAGVKGSLSGQVDLESLMAEVPKTYSIYGSLLLLPQRAFQSSLWQQLLRDIDSNLYIMLFEIVSRRFKVSHIAINAPIPLRHHDEHIQFEESDLNIVRTPTNLTPLFGDFGPICSAASPAIDDFSAAFWTRTKQNGITQVWAPRYTMFSRGNIAEKARVLGSSSVKTAVSQSSETGCCAVDLYAGIGYFAFSYVAANVKRVLCWDLNPWSIEGLRRGAVANKWGIQVFSGENIPADGEGVTTDDKSRFVAFVEGNDMALGRIEAMRSELPPIRHVNCGLLPTSKGSYATAAAALDPTLGGWVHVHENFAVAEIDDKAKEVRQDFIELLKNLDVKRGIGNETERRVEVEHIQRVKSYAPGIFHCVVDIFVSETM